MPYSINCDLHLCADDSALLVSSKNIGGIERELERELCNQSKWLIGNRLSLHLGETESVIYC